MILLFREGFVCGTPVMEMEEVRSVEEFES